MTVNRARRWLILFSLCVTGVQIVFFVAAPALGFPLQYPKNLDLLQIVSPVFLGYLGAASHFIFQNPAPDVPVQNEFLGLLVKGPIIIYSAAVIAALSAFAYSNRQGAVIGNGMSIDALAMTMSISLGVLAVSTGILTSYLFVAPQAQQQKPLTG